MSNEIIKDFYNKILHPRTTSLLTFLQEKDYKKIIKADEFYFNKIINLYKLNSLVDFKDILVDLSEDIERINSIKVKTPEKIKMYHYGRISAYVDMGMFLMDFQEDYKNFIDIITKEPEYLEFLQTIRKFQSIETFKLAKKLDKNIPAVINLYKKYKNYNFVNVAYIGEENDKKFFYSLSFKAEHFLLHLEGKKYID